MRVDVLTIFPGVFPGPLGIGVVGRALESGTLALQAHDLRDHTDDRHRQVDDIPFGGGPGMVLKPEPLVRAVRAFRAADFEPPLYTRPAIFEGREVPEVLRSGHHAAIEHWRLEQAEERRRRLRPDPDPLTSPAGGPR